MEYKEYRAKSVEEATMEAAADLGVESSKLDIDIVSEGSAGFLGIGSKPAIINARLKEDDIVSMTREYLDTQKDCKYRPGDANEGGGGATVVILK
jgi:spoIIIJ-associated protein